MSPQFAIHAGTRIDEYGEHHIADLQPDGTLHVLDADRDVAGTYPPARWTVLATHVRPHSQQYLGSSAWRLELP
ncbi:hypothetical protein JWS13_01120 (plasmid) [Rhodococcus pseudokoreensis]|uniref:Uncharacterized protein n=1 Tax=Rhodococcus pseudokoreensis TaxID=2811421 RepID=A0A974VWW3_9NOCA|nr:hypothetical protein [Rhodococcus pseudokoreensis]QSE87308.1 hypothetical protein JWS13_01120 [Rhodococcus pseudokoreensis]